MKILTIVCNVLLLGLACLGFMTRGATSAPVNPIFMFLSVLVPVLDIVFMLESRVHYRWLAEAIKNEHVEEKPAVGKQSAAYLSGKIITVILNLVFAGFAFNAFVSQYPHPWSFVAVALVLFVILTPVLSLITILISKPNKFKDLKRTLIFAGVSLAAILISFVLTMRVWIGQGIKEHISIAKQQYSGIAEDALIAYLTDSTHTPRERTDIAIWTLGQIRSQKALPVLKKLYKNDPEGMSCKYHHNEVLCQYEIHKAIVSIEHGWLGAKEKNWFGSWSRLNK
jgi:hypothetical protein